MTLFLKSDIAAAERTLLDSVVFDPAAEFTKYADAASNGGYTIDPGSVTFLQDVFAALIEANGYTCWAFFACGGMAYKDFGTGQPKVLPLRGPANTPATLGTLATVGTSGGKPYIGLASSAVFFNFDVVTRVGSEMGCILRDSASDTNVTNGISLSWTADSTLHQFSIGEGGFFVAPGAPGAQAQLRGPSEMAIASADVASWNVDFDTQTADLYKNGAGAGKAITGFPANHTTAGSSQTVQLKGSGANRQVVFAGLANAGADMKAAAVALAAL